MSIQRHDKKLLQKAKKILRKAENPSEYGFIFPDGRLVGLHDTQYSTRHPGRIGTRINRQNPLRRLYHGCVRVGQISKTIYVESSYELK